MAYSSSSSDSIDKEDSNSESNLSLSVGYFPSEDAFYVDTTPYEDMLSESPSAHFLPPAQGMWRTESVLRTIRRQDQSQDTPEQYCKLSITLAWDVDVGSNISESIAMWDLNRHNRWMGKYPEKKTEMTLSKLNGLVKNLEKFIENQKDDTDSEFISDESTQKADFQLSSSSPPGMTQTSPQKHSTCQDLTNFKPPENKDVTQFPPTPLRLQELHEITEISQTTGNQKASTLETSSNSSGQAEKKDNPSNTQTLSCLNFGWVFRWLRRQVLSSLLGRDHPEKATISPRWVALKERISHRSMRIQPQECLHLVHPIHHQLS
ncbi:PREDICTED: uncharacterized protein C12orf71 homolog [Chrysochloris asiatica]|uniref:Uncharacterized protein C12orf71 homolog n=1 Tax=Chrysochloris asiatica TaxID=185453 RepID=A0A9B0WT62_CHRAS|nr:PREDICTED: uncharacterized protein C12orf71 homolog [Chrysochloris asiatica]